MNQTGAAATAPSVLFASSQRVHFIGIGGIGMSGIAEILLTIGCSVSGSDLRRSAVTDRLLGLGARIFEGHTAANVAGADVVVTTSAVNGSNPEVAEARARRIPVISRAEMLAELMRLRYGIAIAGMHGKTTTTSMVAAVLAGGGLDPTVVVGGRVEALGSNARLGTSRYLVVEADESDRSFLKLSPVLGVITNLDREHMDCYRDMADVESAFLEFMDRMPFYGATTVCVDDPLARGLVDRARRRVHTYGEGEGAEFRLTRLPAEPGSSLSRFSVTAPGQGETGPYALHVPGRHNVLNATAAVALGLQIGIAPEQIAAGLESFRGVDRRFQHRGTARGVSVIDDYGHHPTEVRATLAAAREALSQRGSAGRVLVLFQPHRFTRTRDLFDEFCGAFADADRVELIDIYAASEEPIEGITAERLAAGIAHTGAAARYAPTLDEAIARLTTETREGDLLLTLGAGNVSQAGPLLLAALAR